MAYYELEPFGEERADLRAGIIASAVANTARDPKKRRAFRPDDFMPKFGQQRERQTWQQQLMLVEQLNVAFGGRDLRSSDNGNTSSTGS